MDKLLDHYGYLGPDSRRAAQLIYATPPQLREASAVFTKHLRPKLRRSVNVPA